MFSIGINRIFVGLVFLGSLGLVFWSKFFRVVGVLRFCFEGEFLGCIFNF